MSYETKPTFDPRVIWEGDQARRLPEPPLPHEAPPIPEEALAKIILPDEEPDAPRLESPLLPDGALTGEELALVVDRYFQKYEDPTAPIEGTATTSPTPHQSAPLKPA